MLMMKERRPPFRTVDGWARCVLLEAGAIRECEEHGWMRDRSDPHARERALVAARRDPPPNVPAERASPLFVLCWIRSATPARNARLGMSTYPEEPAVARPLVSAASPTQSRPR
jgi:hypothetical protein